MARRKLNEKALDELIEAAGLGGDAAQRLRDANEGGASSAAASPARGHGAPAPSTLSAGTL